MANNHNTENHPSEEVEGFLHKVIPRAYITNEMNVQKEATNENYNYDNTCLKQPMT